MCQALVGNDQYQRENELGKSERQDKPCESIFVFADGGLGRHEVHARAKQSKEPNADEGKRLSCLFPKRLVK